MPFLIISCSDHAMLLIMEACKCVHVRWMIFLKVTNLHIWPSCRTSFKPVMHNETVCQISTLLTLLEGCLLKASSSDSNLVNTISVVHLERIFLYCLAWSLGGLLNERDRLSFDIELRAISSSAMPTKVGERIRHTYQVLNIPFENTLLALR
jgi:hypothetical protein